MVSTITAPRRGGRGKYSTLFEGAYFLGLMGWDFLSSL
jgi:hypothetical protein